MVPDDLAGLRKLYLGFISSRVILTAVNLGIFDSLTKAAAATEIAKKLKTDPRATEILLDALTGVGLVNKSSEGRYRNAPVSNRYLIKGVRIYQGDIIKHASTMWQNFSGLDEVVRTGRPARRGFDHESFIRGMHNLTVLRTEDLIKAVKLKGVKTMLDLGGGPGTNAIAMARKGVKATVFDLPATIKIAKKIARSEGVKGVGFIAGDFHVDSFGSGYDLILVSQIVHAFSAEENIALLRKCRKALNIGGRVAVQEFPINDARTAPPHSALFSVNMLVGTEKGRCYSPREIKHWLVETGYKKIGIKNLPETVVIIGEREG
ncbi:MAG: methyltransferase domain-containing protein [Nitrospirae bacterium]|nr:methyltransferase domain-containing protein [Nitrospirota bacterium]